MKCRSERPLPPVFSISFVVIFGGVVVFGHRESVGKLKKINFSFFFFTMKQSRLKIMEKVFIFFVVRLVVILFGCQESVGKLKKNKVFIIFF